MTLDTKNTVKNIIIILFIALFFVFQKCNNDKLQQLKGEYKILKQDYQDKEEQLKSFEAYRIKEQDSLNKEIVKREKENEALYAINNEIQKQINSIKNETVNVPQDTDGLVKYYNTRYNTNSNLVIGDKVGLTTPIAYKVSNELVEKDKFEKIIPLMNQQLIGKDKSIFNLEKDKIDLKTQLGSSEQNLIFAKELEEAGKKNINNLTDQVKKLQIKNTFNTILIPVAFIGGGFIGYQIAK